jgi:hypothetical protein
LVVDDLPAGVADRDHEARHDLLYPSETELPKLGLARCGPVAALARDLVADGGVFEQLPVLRT